MVRTLKKTTFARRKVVRARPKFAAKPRARPALNARTGGYMGMELKFHDATKAATNIVGAIAGGELDPATADCINGIAQGDGESQRDGRKYLMKSVQVNGVITRAVDEDLANVPGHMAGWVALVLDTQTNLAQLNAEDVYTGNENEVPFRNLQFSSRFKVLAYKVITFDAPQVGTDGTNTMSSGGQVRHFHWNVPLDIPVITTGTGATVSSISDNSLHVIGSASLSTAPNQVALTYNSRVRFIG